MSRWKIKANRDTVTLRLTHAQVRALYPLALVGWRGLTFEDGRQSRAGQNATDLIARAHDAVENGERGKVHP